MCHTVILSNCQTALVAINQLSLPCVCVCGGGGDNIFGAEPGRELDTSSSRNSGNDKAVGRGSTVKGVLI